ncbi:LytTR family transcriptional regulator [Puteibacter caeruleilacunae]|nr:LytTR family transcriptional regulator [Puteibacter caeruleilacunae]
MKQEQTKLLLKTNEVMKFVKPREIVYCKGCGNYSMVYFEDHNHMMLSGNIGCIAQRFNQKEFYRIHKSVVVNIYNIRSVNSTAHSVEMCDGTILPISHRQQKKFLQFLAEMYDNL